MITQIFNALGIQAINSQTFANGYYYEYSLEIEDGGTPRIMRRLRNNSIFGADNPRTEVETDEQIQECKQAIMYNFPSAFNIDGSVAIDLREEVDTPE